MPQASDELRKKWGIDDGKATKFLKDAGFILNRDWSWTSPKPENEITEDEWGAISFMIQEWDYGGLKE